MSWGEVAEEIKEKYSLDEELYNTIKSLMIAGYKYEDIYTAIHKLVDLNLYDCECDKIFDWKI